MTPFLETPSNQTLSKEIYCANQLVRTEKTGESQQCQIPLSLPENTPVVSLTVFRGCVVEFLPGLELSAVSPAESPALAPAGPGAAGYLRRCPLLEELVVSP